MPKQVWGPPREIDGSDDPWPTMRLRALSYVTGVLLKGDGSVYITSCEVFRGGKLVRIPVPRIELKNKSMGFLIKFNEECARVLQRKTVKASWPNKEGHRMVRYVAKDFVSWWQKRNLANMRKLVEAFPVEYLRGRFDSDANVGKYSINLVGIEPHRRLMEFERHLCKKLGMRVGRVRSYGKVGDVTFIGSKKIVSRQPKIRFSVNTRDFARGVGKLSVEWKQKVLSRATKMRQWTPWPSRLRGRALKLATRGLDCKRVNEQISRQFQTEVPYYTVYFWLRKGVKAWEEHSKIRRLGNANSPTPRRPTLANP